MGYFIRYSVQLFATPWTVARQALLAVRFPRKKYWSGLPFPSPGNLPDLGIEPLFPALAGGFFTTEPPCCGLRLKIKDQVFVLP